MNLKTEAIALAVRLLSEHTTLIRKPDTLESAIYSVFGMETYDRQIARAVEEDVTRAVNNVKRLRTNRKFKKITENI